MDIETVMADKDWRRCTEFHGHSCPGLALGYIAARAAMAWLNSRRSPDEELVAIVETDACGVDAIQVLTGCTFGKGNLIHRDYGKMCFTFLSRATGRGLRLALKEKAMAPGPRQQELLAKAGEKGLGDDEELELARLGTRRIEDILNAGAEALFQYKEVEEEMPAKARIAPAKPCAQCGEPTMEGKLAFFAGQWLCRACLTD